ncbi:J domain-containing protein, partial [Pseudomonas urethralis]|uniref:J domain-containing protein n=1 Tax=Pseudomonas urethralis TaxID=2740517 RepID=UPI00159696EB
MNASADCWKTLDLSATADERTLKRQYAKLPKLTRPDADPVAFQRLREAYEQA